MSSGPEQLLGSLSAEDRELLAHLLGQGRQRSEVIASGTTSGDYPLTAAQKRLWAVDQLHTGDPAYNLGIAFRIKGVLDVASLQWSVDQLVLRHEALRTTFHLVGDRPVQRIGDARPVAISVVDLSELPPGEREAAAAAATRQELDRPFVLDTGPLFRTALIILSDNEHLLLLAMHHIVSDGWSIGVLARELGLLYDAHRSSRSTPITPLPIRYADVALWQEGWLNGDDRNSLVSAWRGVLDDVEPSALPLDAARPARPSTHGAHEEAVISPDLARAVDDLARREGATRFMALLAAFTVLVARFTGRHDALVGLPVAGRNRAEVEPLVGLFVNLLPLRVVIGEAMTFGDMLRHVREQTLSAFDRQDLPFDVLLDELGVERRLDRHPLFQLTFSAQDALARLPVADGLVFEPFELATSRTRFDLEAHVIESAAGVRLAFIYNAHLFSRSTVRALLSCYVSILDACVAAPERSLLSLPLVAGSQGRRIADDGHGVASAYPRDAGVPTLFERQATARPDGIALRHNGRSLTYRELERRANQLAHHLQAQGVRAEARIAVCVDRSFDLIVALLAVLKAGAAYVPLDPVYPRDRLDYMVRNSDVRVAITTTDLADVVPVGLTQVHIDRVGEELVHHPTTPPAVSVTGDQLAYVTYTSGSTGMPKGVEVTHRGILRLLCETDYVSLGPDETLLHMAPVTFDASTFEIWGALLHGGTVVVYPERLPQLERLARVLAEERVTTLWLTASLYNAVIDHAPRSLSGIRQLLIGGEALSVAHVARGLEQLPGTKIINGYGPTEGTTFTCCYTIPPQMSATLPVSIPIGRPIANTRVCILDEALQLVPVGAIGELFVGGDGLARGYTRSAALTAERFVPDPVGDVPGARLYRTGDLVRQREDGTIEFLGRRDGQVKVRGHRIELGEIEAATLRHPAVQKAAADVHVQGAAKQLVVYIVPAPGAIVGADDVRSFLRSQLPEYMVPAAVVSLATLPLTPNGKLDRRALPAPAVTSPQASDVASPSDPIEERLSDIWAEVLGVQRVAVHDNFFELGGDSILAIQIASRATRAGLPLAPSLFFEHQTVAELARAVMATTVTAEQRPIVGVVPLSPIQRWFFAQDLTEPAYYHQSVLLELRTDCDERVLQTALDTVVNQHDALRAAFLRDADGEWIQQIAAPGLVVPLECVDLADASMAEQDAGIERRSADIQAGMHLDVPPLVRAAVFNLGSRGRRFLLAIHHLVVDAVSWRVLLDDLGAVIESVAAGRPCQLPLKTSSVLDWAGQLAEFAASESFAADREFWRERQLHAIPLLFEHPPASGDAGAAVLDVSASLGRDETTALLRDLPGAFGLRINDVALASVAAALAGRTGRSWLRIDVESHGRAERLAGAIDLSRTIGWFTSLFPVELAVDPKADPVTLSRLVHDATDAIPHNGIGYGVLKYLSRLPELLPASSDVGFNYLGQLDQSLATSGVFGRAVERIASPVGPSNPLSHGVDVNAYVIDECLTITWRARAGTMAHGELAAAAQASASFLRSCARRCRPDGQAVDAGRFPAADLAPALLLDVVGRFGGERVADVYPVTALQRGMLLQTLSSPEAGAFITQFDVELAGQVDGAGLHAAWRELQSRHPILRTAFCEVGDGDFRQVVLREAPLPWVEHGVGMDDAAADRFEQYLDAERRRGFDLQQAPLMRLALFHLAPDRSHMVWTHHHALLDGWSVAMLLEELFTIYAGELKAPQRARPLFRDYVTWARSREVAASETFWREYLRDSGATHLSSDRRPGGRVRAVTQITEQEIYVDASATASVSAFAARERLTLSTIIHAAWALVLSRHSGSADVVFGTAVSGRSPEVQRVEEMVGLLLNGLPVRVQVDAATDVRDFLIAAQRQLVAIRDHEHVALWEIQQWIGRSPVFDTTVAFENYPVSVALGSVTANAGVVGFRLLGHNSDALHLRVVPGERLRLMLSHDEGRFDAGTARALLEQVQSVLEQMASATPSTLVGELSLARTRSTGVLPVPAAPPQDRWTGDAVHQQVVASARRDPDRVALSGPAGTWTYGDLDNRSGAIAATLRGAGIGTREVVAIHAARGAELVAALLGILRAGAAFTIIDPAYPPSRAAQYLDRAGVSRVICAAEPDVPGWLRDWAREASGRRLLELRLVGPSTRDDVCMPAERDDLAYVAFTSGSTGEPKPIMGCHASLAWYGRWLAATFAACPSDRFSVVSALAHDPLLRDVFPALQAGATLCIPGPDVFDRPGAMADWMATERVTFANLTPAMGQLLLIGVTGGGLPSLRQAFFVGEPLTHGLARRVRDVAPQAACVNLYGATETQQALSYFVLPDVPLADGGDVVPVGRGIPGVDLLVLNAGRRLAGVGEVGDIWMRSPMLASGYLGEEDSTRERFVDDVLGPGTGRAYRTGDRGRYLPDGNVVILGRSDDQIKIRGFRIEPAEIEGVLLDSADVREAAVVAAGVGGSAQELVVYVCGNGDLAGLRRRIAARLPSYMLPSRFVALERLPRTATGKIDRRTLATHAAEYVEADAPYSAPRTTTEETLARVWGEMLQVDRIGVEDSFFDRGGHSIRAAQLIARMRDLFDVDLRISDLFERPRVAEFAALVDERVAAREAEMSQLVEEIKGLSADELRALLDDAGPAPSGVSE